MTGAFTVLVEGRPIATLGSTVSPHPCCGVKGCPPVHCAAKTLTKNFTIFAGFRPVVTVGDLDTCLHPRVTGAKTVFAGIPGT
jgi:hypothetical protein